MAVLPRDTNEKLHVVRFELVRRQICFERLFGPELFVELVALRAQGIGVFCPRRQAGEAKQRTNQSEIAKAIIRIHQRKYSSPGTRIYSWRFAACHDLGRKSLQRRSSYIVPAFRA